MPGFRIGLCYDFRNPPDSGIPMPRLYAAALEQIAWADALGFDQVWFTEHHFVDDGYLPSWIPVAAAAAARTKRVRFSTDICRRCGLTEWRAREISELEHDPKRGVALLERAKAASGGPYR